jgi:hypothetical protein
MRSRRKRGRGGKPFIFFDWIFIMNDTTNTDSPYITHRLVPESERMAFVDRLFGIKYVLQLEPTVFRFAEQLAENYDYGYWQFYTLSNGGFFMALRSDTIYNISCDNGFEGTLSADGLGIVACLYAYSHLSFGDGAFAQTCAEQYHLLREYMFGHPEVRAMLRAID